MAHCSKCLLLTQLFLRKQVGLIWQSWQSSWWIFFRRQTTKPEKQTSPTNNQKQTTRPRAELVVERCDDQSFGKGVGHV